MNPRLAAAKALAAVLNGKASLNSSLPTQLDKVEDRDRGFTQDLAFGTARWQPRLSALAAKLLQKPFKAADADVEALPDGIYAQVAVYSDHFSHVSVMRKVLLRMTSWLHYLYLDH